MPLEGLQLGHYRLLRLIGSGGMGEVYLAEDPRINRQVAVKVIRTEASSYANSLSNQDAARLFQREAKAIAMLDHPYILPLYDYGEEPLNGAVFTYLVMPFRPEGSLTNWMRQRGDQLLSSGDVEHFIHQAATALQYAHDRQIIHQDVKPSNFLIRENRDLPNRPDLLLTDFGVAKLSTATSSVSHSIRGTPTYMAPEQWSGDPVPATDQYALAVMAYELLVGRPPFHGPPMRMMYLHSNTPVQPPSTLNPQLSADVDAVLLCALAKQPQSRFASISAFANAFRQAMHGIDAPTLISAQSTQPPTDSKDISVTLAISQAEAIYGTQRKLTLPNGRQIQVIVPANAYDGQILRLDALSDPGGSNVSVGVLMLRLAVKQVAEPVTPFVGNSDSAFPMSDPNLLKTLPASNPNLQATMPAASNPHLFAAPQAPVTPIPPMFVQPQLQSQPPPKKAGFSVKVALLVGLALLIVFASAGFFVYTTAHNQSINTAQANATTTAQANAANTAQTSLTATGQANALSTARASGAATAQANTLATAQANGVASAQITATAAAIATAQANANATASASHTSDPYPPYTGTLALSDPLSSNNQGNGWDEYANNVSACSFTGGAYQVKETKNQYYADCFSTPYFGNFAYQVQMQIAQGDCGGIIFRADASHALFYFFRVCQDGSYALLRYVDNTNTNAVMLGEGNSNAIQTGPGATNIIAAVANSDQISLYANNQYIASAVDNNYSVGHIALFAQSEGNTTDVNFSNLMVWTM